MIKSYDFLRIALEGKKATRKKKWYSEKSVKHPVPEGFFTDNSAEEIARKILKIHNGDYNSAIKALTFQLNRNKNQSEEIKNKIRKAIEILQKERDKKEKNKR